MGDPVATGRNPDMAGLDQGQDIRASVKVHVDAQRPHTEADQGVERHSAGQAEEVRCQPKKRDTGIKGKRNTALALHRQLPFPGYSAQFHPTRPATPWAPGPVHMELVRMEIGLQKGGYHVGTPWGPLLGGGVGS